MACCCRTHIKLLGAFDDAHIFLDPRPDPVASFAERRRLADLRSASWADYDQTAISDGGGVFSRSASQIPLSAQIRDALGVAASSLTPDELIRKLLRAPVDLLWSAGAGTFIKATCEDNAGVGDNANDSIRIDATALRCRVVGEATSGGFTQKGRNEYALSGGRINMDAIDTMAAVNWIDHHVNLSILLDAATGAGRITTSDRDHLLVTLTDTVSDRVLGESYRQVQALSIERSEAPRLVNLHLRLIDDLESRGLLDRELEHLPAAEIIFERQIANGGLTSPELSVLLCHAKLALAHDLLESDLPEDEYLAQRSAETLPASLRDLLGQALARHRLRREIITTDLVNGIVDRAGTTFVSRLAEETGRVSADIARAYVVAVGVFQMVGFWREVDALDGITDQTTQWKILLEGRRLVTRAARWLLAERPGAIDIGAAVSDYGAGAAALWEALPEILSSVNTAAWNAHIAQFARPGVLPSLAARVAAMDAAFYAFDIVESARQAGAPIHRAGAIHFRLDGRLELGWLRDRILQLPRADIWQTLARSALRDSLYRSHRTLTAAVLTTCAHASTDIQGTVDEWLAANAAGVTRYLNTLTDIRTSAQTDFMTLFVAAHELTDLVPQA